MSSVAIAAYFCRDEQRFTAGEYRRYALSFFLHSSFTIDSPLRTRGKPLTFHISRFTFHRSKTAKAPDALSQRHPEALHVL